MSTIATPLEGAQWAVERGFCVHPTDGKVPQWKAWQTRATLDYSSFLGHLEEGGNYGIAARQSDLLIIDEDTPGEFARWASDHGVSLPETLTVSTGKGRHYYYTAGGHEYGNTNPLKKAGYNIDVRGAGYVIGPGSLHHDTGAVYQLDNDTDPVPVPPALHAFLTDQHEGNTSAGQPALPHSLEPVEVAERPGMGAWQRAAIAGVLNDLASLAGMAEGERRGGHGWDALTYNYAMRLVGLSNTDPAAYPRNEARADFMQHAPTCQTFGPQQHAHKWQSAENYVRDTPAQPRENLSDNAAFIASLATSATPQHTARDLEPVKAPGSAPKRNAPLKWEDVLNGPPEPEDWVLWPMVERGKQVTLFSAPKQGKSLLTLDLVAAACAGHPGPNDKGRAPICVLYLDAENTSSDLRERLQAMDYSPSDLENLTYISFPILPPLDTERGAQELHELVLEHRPDLIVIDTISRFISGDENDSRTWLDLYRLTLAPLKGQNIAVLRLDHTGKDIARGERGSSAKTGDVDASYLLTYQPGRGTRTIKREISRNGHGPERVALTIQNEPLRHRAPTIAEAAAHDPVNRILNELDAAKVPLDWGRRRVREVLRERNFPARSGELEEALRRRKELGESVPRTLQDSTPLGHTFGAHQNVPQTRGALIEKAQVEACPTDLGHVGAHTQQCDVPQHPATLKVAGVGHTGEKPGSVGQSPTTNEPESTDGPIIDTPPMVCPACLGSECTGECEATA